jgi:hypothetical protein
MLIINLQIDAKIYNKIIPKLSKKWRIQWIDLEGKGEKHKKMLKFKIKILIDRVGLFHNRGKYKKL